MKMYNNMYYPNFYDYRYRAYINNTWHPTFYHNLNYMNNNPFSSSHTENIDNSNINERQEQIPNKDGNFLTNLLNITDNNISIFGFSIALDDLIIIALILLLLVETETDFSLIIVLGLLLFNISFSSFNLL